MSDSYNFTERVRRVLAAAREEASAMNHEYVGTEHILLGMLKESEGVACAVLGSCGIDREKVRSDMMQQMNQKPFNRHVGPDLPYTSRAKKVMELTMAEARDFRHTYVGTEHLLLGLLREEKGVAAQMLVQHGLSTERVRAETVRILGSADSTPGPMVFSHDTVARTEKHPSKMISAVFVEMHFDDGTTIRKEFANTSWAVKYLENT